MTGIQLNQSEVIKAFRRYLAQVVTLVTKPHLIIAPSEQVPSYLGIGVDAACPLRATGMFITVLQEIQLAVLSDIVVLQPDVLVGAGVAVGVWQPDAYRIPVRNEITQSESTVPVRTGDIGNYMGTVCAVAGGDVVRRVRMFPVHPLALIPVASNKAGIGTTHQPITSLSAEKRHLGVIPSKAMIPAGGVEFIPAEKFVGDLMTDDTGRILAKIRTSYTLNSTIAR